MQAERRVNPYMQLGTEAQQALRPVRREMYGYYSRKFSQAIKPYKVVKNEGNERMKIAERPAGGSRVAGYDQEAQRRLRREARKVTDRLVFLLEEMRSFRKIQLPGVTGVIIRGDALPPDWGASALVEKSRSYNSRRFRRWERTLAYAYLMLEQTEYQLEELLEAQVFPDKRQIGSQVHPAEVRDRTLAYLKAHDNIDIMHIEETWREVMPKL